MSNSQSVLANRSLHQNLSAQRVPWNSDPKGCLQALPLSIQSLSPIRESVLRLANQTTMRSTGLI